MAKIRFNDYLKKKNKQTEILFESDEDIIRRVRGRMEADAYIVSPDYRIENYRQSEKLISQIEDYPGAEDLLKEFRSGREKAEQEKKAHDLKLAEQHYHDACTEDEFRKVQKEAAALGEYENAKTIETEAAAKADVCRRKTTRKRWILLVVILALAAAAAAFVFSGMFSYMIARVEGMAGVYVSARNRFEKMGDFLDAKEQADYDNQKYLKQREKQEKSSLSDAEAGDTVDFGGFTWIVADREDTFLTLILKTIDPEDVFGAAAYHESAQDVTWADSTLRKYLNTEVLEAFAPAECEAMQPQTHTPCANSAYGTDGGEQTEDVIRIPDVEEAEGYMEEELFSAPDKDVWLCTPGHDGSTAVFLTRGGRIMEYGNDVSDVLGILAVVTVDYSKLGQ